MTKLYPTLLAATAWVSPLLLAAPVSQSASDGFFEDSTWSLLNRTVYENRDYRHGGRSNGARNAYKPRDQRNGYAEEWGYGLMGEVKSGFTQGTLGFGLDGHLYLSQKLDGGGGRAGKLRHMPVDSDGYDQGDAARGGAAVKARLSSTWLRYGEQRVKTPLFSSSDSRLLPETHTGWFLDSREIDDLVLSGGHFTGSADRNSRSNNNPLVINYANPAMRLGNAFSFVGGTYSGVPGLSFSLYGGELQDSWRSAYLGASYSHAVDERRALGLDLNLYRSRDTGRALAGEVANTTGSLLLSYTQAYHRLALGYQQVDGDTPFDYVTRGAIWLGNAVQLSDFNAPNERSWQLAYTYDLAGAGVPGLSAGAAYVRGSGIDGSDVDANGSYAWLGYGKGGKHWERDLNLRYVVQAGAAKDLALLLRHSVHRGNAAQAEGDVDQLRLSLEYPLSGRL
ncbi:imipenem/basic amino acid-specific outer membrane pore [Pseudomonas flavescens]|uniref:Imipenem/basic amino acid-specific outer membrane pore n=1 Tax=Phytopseudomonas flavescens TaxID=29435 RepID=A0A1G8K920_9GAMM|nr:OprD family porin [Pseudomonas flavescens]SDI39857.1 imipenem/basic amino acid-specific outer membrane pore [Pseudomonas flavescens]